MLDTSKPKTISTGIQQQQYPCSLWKGFSTSSWNLKEPAVHYAKVKQSAK